MFSLPLERPCKQILISVGQSCIMMQTVCWFSCSRVDTTFLLCSQVNKKSVGIFGRVLKSFAARTNTSALAILLIDCDKIRLQSTTREPLRVCKGHRNSTEPTTVMSPGSMNPITHQWLCTIWLSE